MTLSKVQLEQRRVELTAHPLQRVGAFALAGLEGSDGVRAGSLAELTVDGFDAAVAQMEGDALRAARVADTKAGDGFWLKTSGSFFPNSKMNHPSRLKKLDSLEREIHTWRSIPAEADWPDAPCALCGRASVGFYGKSDIALAESVAYRNSTPRAHAGMALCWPCLCSFHALPYGCVLTGGPSSVVHSWDEVFLETVVRAQVRQNHQHIALGRPVEAGRSRDLKAVRVLRHYRPARADPAVEPSIRDGVELYVFSNSNRDQVLDVHRLSRPLAQWLIASGASRYAREYWALKRAHQTEYAPASVVLARALFNRPEKIIPTAAGRLRTLAKKVKRAPDCAALLARACFAFAEEALEVKDSDTKEIEDLAERIALKIEQRTDISGEFTGFLRASADARRLRSLLLKWSVAWLSDPPRAEDGRPLVKGPLVNTAQFRLLFDPDVADGWLHRSLLTFAVLERLCLDGWEPPDGKDVADAFNDEVLSEPNDDDEEEE